MPVKQLVLTAVLLLLCVFCVPAVDFGGTLDNETAFGSSGGSYFEQSDKLSVWFNTGIEHNLVFSIMGSYTFRLDRPYLFDMDDLRLYGDWGGREDGTTRFGFTLGRFVLSDPTGLVMDHRVDGFSLKIGYPKAVVSSSFGYTGLQLKPVSTVIMSKADVNAALEDAVILGSPRIVGSVRLDLPSLVLRQKVTGAFLFQEDLRPLTEGARTPGTVRLLEEGTDVETAARGGNVDTQYGVLSITGPIVSGFYHDTFFVLGTGRELSFLDGEYAYTPILSFCAGGALRYYSETLLFSVIEGGFLFSRGDDDKTSFYEGNTAGKSTQFLPVSDTALGQIFNPRIGNLMVAQFSYSLKPLSFLPRELFKRLQSSLDAYLFFRSSLGPVSEGGIDLSSSARYLGTEVDLTINFGLFSDLGLKSSTGLFFPSSAAFASDEAAVRFEESLEFSFSF